MKKQITYSMFFVFVLLTGIIHYSYGRVNNPTNTSETLSETINVIRGGPSETDPLAIPVQITGVNASPWATDLDQWTGSWQAPQAIYDQGEFVNDPLFWSNIEGNPHSGSTWSNPQPGEGYGILIVDLQQVRDIISISVFQMFSDGKATHIALAGHPYTGNTPPDAFDGDWEEFLPVSSIDPGTNHGTYVSHPSLFTMDASTRYVKIMAYNDGSYGYQSFIELKGIKMYSSMPDCPPPYNLSVSDITESSADLSWMQLGDVDTWDIEWGSQGFSPGNGTLIQGVTQKPYTLTDLNENTSYDFYVRAVCDDEITIWIGPRSFKTHCLPFELPIVENFDDSYYLPECWTFTGQGDYYEGWVVDWWEYNSPPNSFFIYQEWAITLLTTPPIAEPINNLMLQFWAKNSYGENQIKIGTVSDPGNATSFTEVQSITLTNNWQQYTVFFDDYSGTDIHIGFQYGSGSNWGEIFIDDIEVTLLQYYNLALVANPAEGGTVEGAGEYFPSQWVEVSAQHNPGFMFMHWSDHNDNIVSYDAHYVFQMPANDLTLTANFTDQIPGIAVSPEELEQSLFSGETAQETLTIHNIELGELNWSISTQFVSKNRQRNLGQHADETRTNNATLSPTGQNNQDIKSRETGDILGIYYNTSTSNTGMVWVNNYLYMLNHSNGQLLKYDIITESVLETYGIHSVPFGITWDGEYLWIGSSSGNVYAYNLDGTSAGYSFSAPFSNWPALSWDGTNFVVNQIFQHNPTIYKVDETGSVLESYTANFNKECWQLVFVPEHSSGNVWATNASDGKIFQVQLSDGVASLVQEFDNPDGSSAYAITHNGVDLWWSGWSGPVFQIDDGITETPEWLAFDIISGIVPAGDSQDVQVSFDASGLIAETYEAVISISSNDPENPIVNIPVTLYVTGAPNISLSHEMLDFGNTPPEILATLPLTITNTGSDVLEISNIATAGVGFFTDESHLFINPGQSHELAVSFYSEDQGVFEGNLSFNTNVEDQESFSIPLYAEVITYPVTFNVVNQANLPVENAMITVYGGRNQNTGTTPVMLTRSSNPQAESIAKPASGNFAEPSVPFELSENTNSGELPVYHNDDRSGEWIKYWEWGVNENAVGLAGDDIIHWYAAIRWFPEDLETYEGYAVTRIRIFMNDQPNDGTIKIWQGNPDLEGYEWPAEHVSQAFTVVQEDWVEVELNNPHLIDTSKELWIGWEIGDFGDGCFPAAFEINSIYTGLSDLVQFGNNPWTYMTNYGFDVAWNIEAYVEPHGEIVEPITLFTDANGQATFDAFTGNYYYTAEKEGHEAAEGSFNVSNQPVDVLVNMFSYEEYPLVTFYVDMTGAEGFDPNEDDVYLTGTFTGWAEPGSPGSIQMSPARSSKTPPYSLYENFESFDDFTTDLSPWITLQLTEGNTWGAGDFDFPGEGTEFAWMVFNPSLTEPPIDETDPPFDGSKVGMAIQYTDFDDDKWLISPEVSIHSSSELSFWARSHTHAYGAERIRVLVSTTDTDPASFTPISTEPYIEVPVEWTHYSYNLGAYAGQTIYFAINYVSHDAFIFFIDAIELTADMDDPDPDPDALIYTASIYTTEGQHQYKYFSNAFGDGWEGGEWPGDPNREIFVEDDMQVFNIWGQLHGWPYYVSLIPDPEDGGTLEGDGNYLPGQWVEVSANHNPGFMFLHWSDHNDNIVSYDAHYVFQMPAHEVTLTANFTDQIPLVEVSPGFFEENINSGQMISRTLTVYNNGADGSMLNVQLDIAGLLKNKNASTDQNKIPHHSIASSKITTNNPSYKPRSFYSGDYKIASSDGFTRKNAYHIFFNDFEDNIDGWYTETYSGDDLWHISGLTYSSPSNSLWCGIEGTNHYDTGSRVNTAIITPKISLPANSEFIYLDFWEYYETEPGWDFCMVDISLDNGNSWIHLRGSANEGSAPSGFSNGWINTVIDLLSYAGQEIRIRFYFDTLDGVANDYPGWFVDDVAIATSHGHEWLSLSEYAAAIPGGEYIEFEVLFNAEDMLGGTYETTIVISSNDPENPMVHVPVTMHVTGAPGISLSHEMLDFGNNLPETLATLPLTITNTGSDVLEISNIATDGDGFFTDDSDLFINPGQSHSLVVSFYSEQEGVFEGLLSFNTNVEGQEDISIPLYAEVITYPVTFNVVNQANQPVENAMITVYGGRNQNTGSTSVMLTRSSNPQTENITKPASGNFAEPGGKLELSGNTNAGELPSYYDDNRSGEWIKYWESGVNDNALGLNSQNNWYAAIRWMPEDLIAYQGHAVTKIRVFINDEPDHGSVIIWQGDINNLNVMVQQAMTVTQEDWVEVHLFDHYLIDTSQELWIGWEIGDPGEGVFPAAFETSTQHDQLANLLQFGDNPWNFASDFGFEVVWNIEAYVEPATPLEPIVTLYTDANGQATFDAFTGNYYYTVEKEGHEAAEGSFNVSNQPLDVFVNMFSDEEYPLVTFYVDMTDVEGFNPYEDDVYLTGTFTNWAEPGSPGSIQMSPARSSITPPYNLYENFENFDDFTTDLAPWITLQLTEGITWGVGDFDFPGEGTEFAWMAFNPSLTEPPINEENPPVDGTKMGMAIQYMDMNDDKWLISPEVSIHTSSQLSFWARSYSHAYGAERIRVLVSTTGADPAGFIPISTEPFIEVPVEWTQYTFNLGAFAGQTIHIAINYVSEDAWVFWIDAIELTSDMVDPDNLIYTASIYTTEGYHEYKYFSNAFGDGWAGGEWHGDPNREIFVEDDMQVFNIWGQLYGWPYYVSLIPDPEGGGILEGDGNYLPGQWVEVSAQHNPGFMFLHWSDHNDNIVSYDAHYVFQMPAHEVTLVANFTDQIPAIAVSPEELEQSLFSGETAQETLTIHNIELGELNWSISTQFVSKNRQRNLGQHADETRNYDGELPIVEQNSYHGNYRETGDILGVYHNSSTSNTGMVWVNNYLYMLNYNNGQLFKYDIITESILESYNVHSSPYGITWDGEYLWIGNPSGNIYAYNLDGTSAGYSFSAPLNHWPALSWDGAYFIVNQTFQYNPTIYRLDETGSVLESYTANFNKACWQLVFVPEHSPGNVWATNASEGKIFQVQLSDGIASLVQEFDNPDGGSAYAITHDGVDLWWSSWSGPVYQIDDGITETPEWLTLDIISGVVPAGESQDVQVSFDASELLGGIYEAVITISSNDPENPLVHVPVTMHVTGAPNISLSHETLDFGNTLPETLATLPLTITNTGTEVLEISNIATAGDGFFVNDSHLFFDPGQSYDLIVSFYSDEEGAFEGLLSFNTNVEGQESISIPLYAEVITYPVTFNVVNQANLPVENAMITVYGGRNQNTDTTPVMLTRSSNPQPEKISKPASGNFAESGGKLELSDNTNAGELPVYHNDDRSGEWIKYWQSGVNDNALGLISQTNWYTAIRWMPTDLTVFEGYAVTIIRVFMNDQPDHGSVMIWQGDINNPNVMVQQAMTVTQEDWVEVHLFDPYLIDTSQELWIGWEIGDPGEGAFCAAFETSGAYDQLANLLQFGDNPWNFASDFGFEVVWNIEAYVEPHGEIVEPITLFTDANGQASFDAFTGNYYYTVEKDGHEAAEGYFNVSNQPIEVLVNMFSDVEYPLVTFYVDMNDVEGFNPYEDDVYLTGSFTGWAEPGSPGSIQMSPARSSKTPPYNFYENFEGYDDFTTDLSPWITLQLTEGDTWGAADFDFPGEGTEFAWMAFNPSETEPPINEENPPVDGTKMGMAIQYMDMNDDKWLISPEVSIHSSSQLSFWARSFTHAYGAERIRVMVSTTGTNPGDFFPISTEPFIEVPIEWTQYSFNLGNFAGQTIHFAINYVSEDAFIFWIDAIELTADMDDPDPDALIYTASIYTTEGQHQYKYFSNAFGDGWEGGEWPGDPNRVIYVENDMEVHDVWGFIDPVDDEFTVHFNVLDIYGYPVEDAMVTMGDMTNPPGEYVFHDVPHGLHYYHVARHCHLPTEGEAFVNQDHEITIILDYDHMPGDANGDGIVNVLDIIAISMYFSGNEMPNFCFYNADVNSDGMVNVLDLIATANIFISKKVAPHKGLRSENAFMHVHKDGLKLDSDGTLAGIQFELSGNIHPGTKLNLELEGYELVYVYENGTIRAMIYSFDNRPFPAGMVRLVSFEHAKTSLQVFNGLAGNLNAEEVPLIIYNESVTGLDKSENLDFKAYPNPAEDLLWVAFNSTSHAKLSLISVHGQVVWFSEIFEHGSHLIKIDLGNLPSGIYMLRLDHADEYLIERIVVK